MQSHIQSILISESQIQARVRQLGSQISEDYKNRDLILIGVLKGAVVFLADLMRSVSIPLRCEFIQISSYGDGMKSSGAIQVIQGPDENLRGSDVLIVEDIVDTGQTLNFLIDQINALEPASVKVCSLLDKPTRRKTTAVIDYVGFEIPDVFVVGYGLDYAQKHRNLPYLSTLSTVESER